jgi:hypothetical protein
MWIYVDKLTIVEESKKKEHIEQSQERVRIRKERKITESINIREFQKKGHM